MAQLDASIVAGIRPVQIADPSELQARQLTLRNLAMQGQRDQLALDQAQREQEQTLKLNDLYRGAVGPDGQVDRQRLYSGLASGGLGSRLPGVQKQFADADKATADVRHTASQTAEIDWKVKRQQLDHAASAISTLLSDPNVSHDRVYAAISSLVDQGSIPAAEGARMARMLPPDVPRLRQFLMEKGLEVMDAARRVEMMVPKTTLQDTGGGISPVRTNQLTGEVSAGPQALAKTVTPGEALSSETQRRGQDKQAGTSMATARMTDARERALAAQGITYQQTEDGGFVALPTKGVPGQTVRGAQVLGPNGQPVAAKGSMTEDQAKASGWLAQAGNAYKNMQAVLAKSPDASKPNVGDVVAAMPMSGPVGQYLRGADRQRFVQAASSMSEAFLRAATGAGVNKEEADQKIREITPQFNDSKALIEQKLASIPVYLKSLEARAGRQGAAQAASNIGGLPGAGAQPGLPAADAIAAELARRAALGANGTR